MNPEYFVIRSETLGQLQANVFEYLKSGWACAGGIAVLRLSDPTQQTGEIIYFYQAMIKINP